MTKWVTLLQISPALRFGDTITGGFSCPLSRRGGSTDRRKHLPSTVSLSVMDYPSLALSLWYPGNQSATCKMEKKEENKNKTKKRLKAELHWRSLAEISWGFSKKLAAHSLDLSCISMQEPELKCSQYQTIYSRFVAALFALRQMYFACTVSSHLYISS